MYGVVEIAGHQYKVQPGDVIDVQKLSADNGSELEFDKVLFIGSKEPLVGFPVVEGAKINAKIVRHARERKIIVFKRKPGSSRSKKGHRQHYTSLLITAISNGKGEIETIDKNSKNAKKFLA